MLTSVVIHREQHDFFLHGNSVTFPASLRIEIQNLSLYYVKDSRIIPDVVKF